MDLTIRFVWNDTKEEVINTIADCGSAEKGAEKWVKHHQLATNSATLEELLEQITVLDIRPAHFYEVLSDDCI
jgi:hypothetical protein